ncbi:hypothetical protein NDU88_000819 [Pleurodeles waltl]|uniref:Uncharacterized protein n=1 Tax=Pleurodeles waltl TaxID=8319 RepID=A0AAV7MHY6_PLEWA|nr:hypothetical protein NDU88_000819 [Pleurodeles waltl]
MARYAMGVLLGVANEQCSCPAPRTCRYRTSKTKAGATVSRSCTLPAYKVSLVFPRLQLEENQRVLRTGSIGVMPGGSQLGCATACDQPHEVEVGWVVHLQIKLTRQNSVFVAAYGDLADNISTCTKNFC